MSVDVSAREALARKHVTRGREIVAKQRDLIARIRAAGGSHNHEDRILDQFEDCLSIFEQDLSHILSRKG